MLSIQHEANRVYALDKDERVIAEATFPAVSDTVVEFNHTFVDPSLRGQGAAGMLLEAAAADVRARGLKARPTCSYAVKWFSEHGEYADLLEK
ncbi:MAG TPA: GNAT family N-acetyltransferase [Feifaniaceae bacterium]|nr:GNAT family N-acetyltransferase [Feifaniaceae bacterium]